MHSALQRSTKHVYKVLKVPCMYVYMCTSISDGVAGKILAKRKMPAHIAKPDKRKIRQNNSNH